MVHRNSAYTSLVKKSKPIPSNIYSVFWRFAAERHRIYLLRVGGCPQPWTSDEVLATYKFTNAYRAADRVSQFLIRMAYSERGIDPAALFLRTILFKVFNKIETWLEIIRLYGMPRPETFDFEYCDQILSGLKEKGVSIYSGAYIMPSGGVSGRPKHRMHLELIRSMLADKLPARLAESGSLEEAYRLLLAYPSLGPFLAFQYSIDLNYTTLMNHSEMDYVVAGPGALDGLSKCFSTLGDYTPEDAIKWLTESQEQELERLGLNTFELWGRKLQLIDVQNLLCEVSKYTRVTHPHVKGIANRTRIKKRFSISGPLVEPFFPPKWGLNENVQGWSISEPQPSSSSRSGRE